MVEYRYYHLLTKCIIPLLLAILINISYYFTLSWLEEVESSYFENYNQFLLNVKKEVQKINNNKHLARKLEIINKKLAKIHDLISSEINLPKIINDIYRISYLFGVDIKSINYIYPNQFSNDTYSSVSIPAKIQIQMDILASYCNIRKFINKLIYSLPYPLFITEITASKDNLYQINLTNLVKEYD